MRIQTQSLIQHPAWPWTALLVCSALALSGCSAQTQRDADQAVESAGDAASGAAEDAAVAVDTAAVAVNTAASDAADAAGEAVDEFAMKADAFGEAIARRLQLINERLRTDAEYAAEEAADEVAELRADMRTNFAEAEGEMAERWKTIDADLEVVETDLRDGTVGALERLQELIERIQVDLATPDA